MAAYKTQSRNRAVMPKGRPKDNWTAFDIAGPDSLPGAALMMVSTYRGSFLAFPRWGEMRTPVFAHVTTKIRRFVSKAAFGIRAVHSP